MIMTKLMLCKIVTNDLFTCAFGNNTICTDVLNIGVYIFLINDCLIVNVSHISLFL